MRLFQKFTLLIICNQLDIFREFNILYLIQTIVKIFHWLSLFLILDLIAIHFIITGD